jgi:hypothetical protein
MLFSPEWTRIFTKKFKEGLLSLPNYSNESASLAMFCDVRRKTDR